MAARTLISVDEYLRTSYSPDCDYVDGEVQERNVGELDHAWLQTLLAGFFLARRKQWGIQVVVEMRVQVSESRFRIPDVCVVLGGKPKEQILTKPPFLCIEILSSEDRVSRVQERVQDYLTMGVSYVWVIDPRTKRTWEVTAKLGWRENMSGILKTENPSLELLLSEVFE